MALKRSITNIEREVYLVYPGEDGYWIPIAEIPTYAMDYIDWSVSLRAAEIYHTLGGTHDCD